MITADQLPQYLVSRTKKESMLAEIKAQPALIPVLIKLCQTDVQPLGWRATWILRNTVGNNNLQLSEIIPSIIQRLDQMDSSHQREWLKGLHKQHIREDDLGKLFDNCTNIWISIQNHAALRATAFEWMMKIAKRFPELKPEVEMLMESDYLNVLTPGIRTSLLKKAEKANFITRN